MVNKSQHTTQGESDPVQISSVQSWKMETLMEIAPNFLFLRRHRKVHQIGLQPHQLTAVSRALTVMLPPGSIVIRVQERSLVITVKNRGKVFWPP